MKDMNRLIKYRIYVWVAAILSALLLAAPAALAEGGSIGGRPALPRKGDPRSESIFIHTINRGQTIPEAVVVANNSDKTQEVDVYAVDAIPSNTGAFTCKQRAETSTGAGQWIKISKQTVTLKPDQSQIVDFAITAPSNADVGEHNACVVLEQANNNGEVSGNLTIRTRSAIRVALTIPGKLRREVAIDSFTVTQTPIQQNFDIILKNAGNVSADTNVKIKLASLFGGTIYTNEGQYPVLAGQRLELSFGNDKLPFFGGWYKATASASYNKEAGTWATSNPAQLATVNADPVVVFIMPQPIALIMMIAILVIVVWLVWYFATRGRRRQKIIDSWSAHKVQEGETIQSLAERTHGSWKRIAKVNNLKAPYILHSGQMVYIPKSRSTNTSNRKG